MIFQELTYAEALAKRDHLIALGERRVSLKNDAADLPWQNISKVEASGSFRFSGPCGARFIVEDRGLTFNWSVDFEHRNANGKGVSLFDRDRLRETMRRMSSGGRYLFGAFLEDAVLPELAKRTAEIRIALNQQADSEDCVRGLIAFAASDMEARR